MTRKSALVSTVVVLLAHQPVAATIYAALNVGLGVFLYPTTGLWRLKWFPDYIMEYINAQLLYPFHFSPVEWWANGIALVLLVVALLVANWGVRKTGVGVGE